jgi:hypothetical protein
VVLYDVPNKKVARMGTTCALTGRSVWATAEGKLLTACADGLVLYDPQLRQIAKFQVALSYYTLRNTLLLSPTHEFIAFNLLPGQSTLKVLATATLTEFDSFLPPSSALVEDLFEGGYTAAPYVKGREGVELSFYGFRNSQPILLLKTDKTCFANGFGVGKSEFLKTCGKDKGEIIDVGTARAKLIVSGVESANFAQTTVSGKRFALGFQDYSKAHTVKQFVNPLTYLEALGTCCDDPSNLFRLKVYDQQSGRAVAEFHWKTNKKEPMWERYDNSAVALSPSGAYVAFLHGTDVEIYRIPD